MNYTSLKFILFVFLLASVYFLFPLKKYKWTVLLAGSCFFYLLAGYRYAVYIFFTTLSTYLSARYIYKLSEVTKDNLAKNKSAWSREDKKQYKEQMKVRKRRIVTIALLANFGILFFLKYYNFLSGSLNNVLGRFSIEFSAPTLKLILPLGISFYTFQSMGYVIDVYREKCPAEKNICKLALFVSFFPSIVQGPISFYSQLANQLYEPHDFDFTRVKHASELILWGCFKKMIIADLSVVAITTVLGAYEDYNGTTLLFTVLLYALQLYTDFSGGIDVSRGVSQVFGIELAENFKRPYFATTITDYWHRWHISLGNWMKDYIFYPVAMSKTFLNAGKMMKKSRFGATKFGAHVAKVLPTSFSSLLVFTLVGIWHGASWKYVAFGIWNGGVIMLSSILEPIFNQWTVTLKINTKAFGFRLFQMARTFLIVLVGYVFDVAPSFMLSVRTFKLILSDQNLVDGWKQIQSLGVSNQEYVVIIVCSLVVLVASIIQERHSDTTIREMLDRKPFVLRYCIWLAGLLMITLFGVWGPGFDPAAFVYMQF